MPPVNETLFNYEDIGFNKFLEKSINIVPQEEVVFGTGSLNFDHLQTTGSLGSKIGIGGTNIILDGENKRIIINDDENDRVLIGFNERGLNNV